MWNPKNMFDNLRKKNASHDGASQCTSTQSILEHSSGLEYQLPRLEFEQSFNSHDPPFLEFPRSSSDYPNRHTADGEPLGNTGFGTREDSFRLEEGNRCQESHKTSPTEGHNLASSMTSKEEDPNLVNSLLHVYFNSPAKQIKVTWDSPDDPTNPLNWTRSRKWAATLIVSSFTFISPVSSTMVAPGLDAIAKEYGISSSIERVLVMSIFLLAYAVGPFVLGPLSEIYGRVVVLQSANMFYLVFNTACGFAKSKEQMLAFRFLSGLGGSAPQAVSSSSPPGGVSSGY